MEALKKFIKQNPLLTAGIVLAICVAGYYLFSGLYANYKIWSLEKQNVELQKERDDLQHDKDFLLQESAKSEGRIQEQEKDLTEKDELLKAATAKVVKDKQSLADATAEYNRIRSDETPVTQNQLRERLCALYPEKCQK